MKHLRAWNLPISLCVMITPILWCRAFSFLRTNKTRKSLVVSVSYGASVSAFLLNIATMLQQNASLQSLTVESFNRIEGAKKHLVLITVLQHNKTLKTLSMYPNRSFALTHDEDKQMAALLKKNYAMESLSDIDLDIEAGDLGAIVR
jgi:hypothetical protein